MSSEGTERALNLRNLAIPSLLLVATFLGYGWILDLDHMGWDAWPLLASTRIEGLGDLGGLFTSEFMGGLFPDGRFYRPLTSLSFALDGLLWGTNPAGFHLTDLLLLAGSALAIFHLARRIPGRIPAAAALFAALLFLLHPIQVELVPAAPRRADALCLLFTLLALCRVARPPSGNARDRWSLALLVLAAALSKETGLVALPLVALFAFFHRRGEAGKAREVISFLSPAVALLGAFLIIRTIVLSGLGGYGEDAPFRGGATGLAALSDLPTRLAQYGAMVLYPQPILETPGPGTIVAALALALALALIIASRVGKREGASPAPFLLLWIAGLTIISSTAGRISWWYGLQFLPPLVLLLASLASRAGKMLGSGQRVAASLLGLVVVACTVPLLTRSGAFVTYSEWQRGSSATERWLDRAQAALEPVAPGARVTLTDLPTGVIPSPTGPCVRSAALLAPYSLVAWLQVRFPGRTFRVAERGAVTLDAGPQGTGVLPIRVEITRRLVP